MTKGHKKKATQPSKLSVSVNAQHTNMKRTQATKKRL